MLRGLAGSLRLFEAMLDGRDSLLGDRLGIAAVIAFPLFLGDAGLWPEDDPDLFHQVLRDHLSAGGHEWLAAWISRVDVHLRV